MAGVEFIDKFKSELGILEKQLIEIVNPIAHINTTSTSLPNL
jgi:hypothetical protein